MTVTSWIEIAVFVGVLIALTPLASPKTGHGTGLFVVLLLPSWPEEFMPQHQAMRDLVAKVAAEGCIDLRGIRLNSLGAVQRHSRCDFLARAGTAHPVALLSTSPVSMDRSNRRRLRAPHTLPSE